MFTHLTFNRGVRYIRHVIGGLQLRNRKSLTEKGIYGKFLSSSKISIIDNIYIHLQRVFQIVRCRYSVLTVMHIFKLSRYFIFYNFTFVLVFTKKIVSIVIQSTESIYKLQITIGVVF